MKGLFFLFVYFIVVLFLFLLFLVYTVLNLRFFVKFKLFELHKSRMFSNFMNMMHLNAYLSANKQRYDWVTWSRSFKFSAGKERLWTSSNTNKDSDFQFKNA